MPIPVLHVIAGPNGAGKTTYYEALLGPTTRLPFVNADQIARGGSASAPFRRAARDADGEPVGTAEWPPWAPRDLRS